MNLGQVSQLEKGDIIPIDIPERVEVNAADDSRLPRQVGGVGWQLLIEDHRMDRNEPPFRIA